MADVRSSVLRRSRVSGPAGPETLAARDPAVAAPGKPGAASLPVAAAGGGRAVTRRGEMRCAPAAWFHNTVCNGA